jgi:hypothetical protein
MQIVHNREVVACQSVFDQVPQRFLNGSRLSLRKDIRELLHAKQNTTCRALYSLQDCGLAESCITAQRERVNAVGGNPVDQILFRQSLRGERETSQAAIAFRAPWQVERRSGAIMSSVVCIKLVENAWRFDSKEAGGYISRDRLT